MTGISRRRTDLFNNRYNLDTMLPAECQTSRQGVLQTTENVGVLLQAIDLARRLVVQARRHAFDDAVENGREMKDTDEGVYHFGQVSAEELVGTAEAQ